MKIQYALLYGLFLFLLSCGSKDDEPVVPDASKTMEKKETEVKKEETTAIPSTNTLPTAAVLTVPADAATDIALNTVLKWDASTDADGDELTYDVYLDKNNPPTTKIASDLSSESATLTNALKSATTYYWFVTTKDGKGGETQSVIGSFTTKNTPPTAAMLTAPADAATNIDLNTDLSWDASIDTDGDELTYDVYLDKNNPPTTKIVSNLSGLSTSLTDALENGTTYYWFVTAEDGKGGETQSVIGSFTTTNTPPTAAMLTAPADAETNVLIGQTLNWNASTDVDGDELTYDVYLDKTNPPTIKIATDVTTLSELISQTNAPDGSTTYYWFVTTKDGKGGETQSEVRSFTTAMRPTAKATFMTEISAAILREGNTADLNYIDTSLITDMKTLFFNEADFNGDISKWNTSKVTTMESMFYEASSFNGDLSKWDVSEVTKMNSMFAGATSFNGDLSEWDVSKVTVMNSMFADATSFNGDLRKWNVGLVTSMAAMFKKATSFNGDLSEWNVSNVTSMSNMFESAVNFEGGDLSNWDVRKVLSMNDMFNDATKFNGDLSEWNVSNVLNMNSMFAGATSFNNNISKWTPVGVGYMNNMFDGASSFEQNIESWNISGLVLKNEMFKGSGLDGKEPSWY